MDVERVLVKRSIRCQEKRRTGRNWTCTVGEHVQSNRAADQELPARIDQVDSWTRQASRRWTRALARRAVTARASYIENLLRHRRRIIDRWRRTEVQRGIAGGWTGSRPHIGINRLHAEWPRRLRRRRPKHGKYNNHAPHQCRAAHGGSPR